MKKVLFTALVAFAIASCSDDDNKTADTKLEGTWKLSSIIVPEAIDLNGDGKKTNDLVKESGCMDQSSITFLADATKPATVKMQDIEITKDASGKSTAKCSAAETTTSAYTVTADKVKLTFDGKAATFTKTGNTLSLTQDSTTITFKK
ncbi:DUF5004 domain-containing protein [Flavobacterium psychrotrophum]|uniref:DUF5004 domain-containing protein n=1 Tax=Flavobacterium psychrotrophum TaxID=2294119 RepID=UPI000E31A180|nr:lipocalin family protein [Flavobacterium psychrotrophum]